MDPPLLNERTALQVAGAGGQVLISKSITNLSGAGCCGERRVTVLLAESLLSDRQQ